MSERYRLTMNLVVEVTDELHLRNTAFLSEAAVQADPKTIGVVNSDGDSREVAGADVGRAMTSAQREWSKALYEIFTRYKLEPIYNNDGMGLAFDFISTEQPGGPVLSGFGWAVTSTEADATAHIAGPFDSQERARAFAEHIRALGRDAAVIQMYNHLQGPDDFAADCSDELVSDGSGGRRAARPPRRSARLVRGRDLAPVPVPHT